MDKKTKSFLVAVQQRLKDEDKPSTLEDALTFMADSLRKKLAPKKTAQDELNEMLKSLEGLPLDAPPYPEKPAYVAPEKPIPSHNRLAAIESRRKIRDHVRTLTIVSVAGILVGGLSYVKPMASTVAGLLLTIASALYAKMQQKEILYLESTYRLDPRS